MKKKNPFLKKTTFLFFYNIFFLSSFFCLALGSPSFFEESFSKKINYLKSIIAENPEKDLLSLSNVEDHFSELLDISKNFNDTQLERLSVVVIDFFFKASLIYLSADLATDNLEFLLSNIFRNILSFAEKKNVLTGDIKNIYHSIILFSGHPRRRIHNFYRGLLEEIPKKTIHLLKDDLLNGDFDSKTKKNSYQKYELLKNVLIDNLNNFRKRRQFKGTKTIVKKPKSFWQNLWNMPLLGGKGNLQEKEILIKKILKHDFDTKKNKLFKNMPKLNKKLWKNILKSPSFYNNYFKTSHFTNEVFIESFENKMLTNSQNSPQEAASTSSPPTVSLVIPPNVSPFKSLSPRNLSSQEPASTSSPPTVSLVIPPNVSPFKSLSQKKLSSQKPRPTYSPLTVSVASPSNVSPFKSLSPRKLSSQEEVKNIFSDRKTNLDLSMNFAIEDYKLFNVLKVRKEQLVELNFLLQEMGANYTTITLDFSEKRDLLKILMNAILRNQDDPEIFFLLEMTLKNFFLNIELTKKEQRQVLLSLQILSLTLLDDEKLTFIKESLFFFSRRYPQSNLFTQEEEFLSDAIKTDSTLSISFSPTKNKRKSPLIERLGETLKHKESNPEVFYRKREIFLDELLKHWVSSQNEHFLSPTLFFESNILEVFLKISLKHQNVYGESFQDCVERLKEKNNSELKNFLQVIFHFFIEFPNCFYILNERALHNVLILAKLDHDIISQKKENFKGKFESLKETHTKSVFRQIKKSIQKVSQEKKAYLFREETVKRLDYLSKVSEKTKLFLQENLLLILEIKKNQLTNENNREILWDNLLQKNA